MAVNDEIFKNLEVYGGGTINERVYNFLGSLGYTGTVSDRLGQFEEGGRKGWQGLIRAWGQWAPAPLFSQGQQGVWYEPKPEYLYQDSAGTTPVTADGDPVGLMLDRHLGLVLGPEAVPDPDLSSSGGEFRVYRTETEDVFYPTGALVEAGKAYWLSIDINENPATTSSAWRISGSAANWEDELSASFIPTGETGEYTKLLKASVSGEVSVRGNGSGADLTFSSISIRQLPGNHATQSTSAARPIYRTDGVLHWLQFDGVDDRLASQNIDFSATDEVTHFSATTTQNDEVSIILECMAGSRGFASLAYTSFRARSGGDLSRDANVSGFSSPITSIGTGRSKISTPIVEARFNRGQWTKNLEDQGSGDYPVATLDIAARGDAAEFPFAGSFYGILITGEFLTDQNTGRVEDYLAKLAGVTL